MASVREEPRENGLILRTEALVKMYGRRRVVDQVSVVVRPGEVVGLLGPNGAGKTTTFYMIVGMIRPNGGRIFLGGNDVTHLPMYRRARKGIGYLPQEHSVFRGLTVEQNIMAILQTLRISRAERQQRLDRLLEDLGIASLAKQRADTLSGGECRRLEIARALVVAPMFMLLDEPFAGIDPIKVENIQAIIHRLRERGLGVLVTDHNVRETLSITDHAYIMSEGRILKEGTATFLAQDPEARRIYLGERFRLD